MTKQTEKLHYLPVWLENAAEPVTPEDAQVIIIAIREKANWKTAQAQEFETLARYFDFDCDVWGVTK